MYICFQQQNYKEINKQIIKFKPKYFLISNYEIYERIKNKYKNKKIRIVNNIKNLNLKK